MPHCTTHYILHTTQHTTHYTLHTTHYMPLHNTLHITDYTLHNTPHTTHGVHCALHTIYSVFWSQIFGCRLRNPGVNTLLLTPCCINLTQGTIPAPIIILVESPKGYIDKECADKNSTFFINRSCWRLNSSV